MKYDPIDIGNDGEPIGKLTLWAQKRNSGGGWYAHGNCFATARKRLTVVLRKSGGKQREIVRWSLARRDTGEIIAEGDGAPPRSLSLSDTVMIGRSEPGV